MLRPPEQQVLDRSHGALVALGDDGRIGFATPEAQHLLRWPRSLAGQRLSAIVPPRLHKDFGASFGQFVVTRGRGRSTHGSLHRHPALCGDGSERPVQILVRGFRRPDGSIFLCAALGEDPGPTPDLEAVARGLAGHGYSRL